MSATLAPESTALTKIIDAAVFDYTDFAVDTLIEWTPRNGIADVHDKPATAVGVVATRLAGLDTGRHILRMCGVEFICWVDHKPATDRIGWPVEGQQVSKYDLYEVTGPNALLNATEIATALSEPYETGCDGNHLPVCQPVEIIATALVSHVRLIAA